MKGEEKNQRIAALSKELECNLDLIGASALEDQL